MGLFHITTRAAWVEAQRDGVYRAPSLDSDGFIHLSGDRQWLGTAQRFFAGQAGLVLLSIRADRLTAEVRYEDADGQRFPHLYGPLDLAAVIDAFELPPDGDRIPVELRPWRYYFEPRGER